MLRIFLSKQFYRSLSLAKFLWEGFVAILDISLFGFSAEVCLDGWVLFVLVRL